MDTTFPPLTTEQVTQRDALIDRLLEASAGVFTLFTTYLGDHLGLYQALAQAGPLTSTELAAHTNTQERYVREWLEQQTVTGILDVENPDATATERRFSLSAAHAEVLLERDSPNYIAPLAHAVTGAVRPIEKVVEAFRNGGGVPYTAYGEVFRNGQAGMNRTLFLQELGQEWLPSIPDLHARLMAQPSAMVADIGCGAGWSSIGMAQAYPNIKIDGFDLDEASIAMARDNAQSVGINGRVNFQTRDAGDSNLAGHYDLVAAFECIHDMGDPVSVLSSMRRLAGTDGTVLVMDERVGDTFTREGNDVEWMMYGWSVLHCLPVGMAEHNSVGTGTVMRTDTLRQYARDAGFSAVEVLPIDNFFFRVYRLVQ